MMAWDTQHGSYAACKYMLRGVRGFCFEVNKEKSLWMKLREDWEHAHRYEVRIEVEVQRYQGDGGAEDEVPRLTKPIPHQHQLPTQPASSPLKDHPAVL
jgi:hypothetical protein